MSSDLGADLFKKFWLFSWLIWVDVPPRLFAATTATATITYNIQAIDAITVSGNPATLNISTATAGSAPSDASDVTTTYAVTTNSTTARAIQGRISSSMPSGVSLKVNLQAPSGGTSAGTVILSTTNANLVTAITQVSQSSLTITYTLSATAAAAVVTTNPTVVVTYTLG
jgi:hypothetical protein